MKNIMFLVGVLMVTLFHPLTVKAATISSTISGNNSIVVGSDIVLTFAITTSETIGGFSGKIKFDSNQLSIKSFEAINQVSLISFNQATGSFNSNTNILGTRQFLRVTFKPSSSFRAGTSTTVEFTDIVGSNLTGTVRINGVSSSRTITATAVKSSNNNLSSLSVDQKPVVGFTPSYTSYNLANTDADSIVISATPSDSKATVSGTGSKTLRYGSNSFDIVVTAESGARKTYTVSVTKNDYRNTNNNLQSLTVEGYDLIFNKDKLTYTLIVDHSVTSVNISAQAEDEKAKVAGGGTKSLKIYSNVFNIVVTAENMTTKTYSVNVVRRDVAGIAGDLSRDNKLKSLSVKDYPFTFDADQLEYEIDVENWIENVELAFELNDPKASAVVSKENELIIGANEILIKVYSESADERIYKITVNRQGDNPVVAIGRILDLLPRIEAGNVEIFSSDPKGLSKEIWASLISADKQYTFSVRNGMNETIYRWHFSAEKAKESDWFDFEVRMQSLKRDKIRKLLNYRESILNCC